MKLNYPVGLISNANAKKIRKTLIDSKELHKLLGGNKYCLLRDTYSLEELKETLAEFRDKNIQVILSNGGDGTHQKLISTLIYNFSDYSPYIIPLKSGTMNMLPKNLGLDMSPHKAVKWVKAVIENKVTPVVTKKNVLEVRSDVLRRKKYGFVFLAGCGYRLLNLYYSYPEGGKRAAAKAIVSSMGSWLTKDPLARSIYTYTPSKTLIDSNEYHFPYLITLASTLERLVLGFSPFALKSDKDGFFFMIDGEPMKKNYRFTKFFKPFHHDEWKPRRLVSRGKALHLEVEDGFSIDGEIINFEGKAKLEVGLGPSINFITPGVKK